MNDKNEIIRVNNLNASFGERKVLSGVSFGINEGEICVILGGSGSGKTTTLKYILKLYRPPEGCIHIFGKDIATISEEEQTQLYLQMGVIYQNGALLNSLTVMDNITLLPQQHSDLPDEVIREMVLMKLALVNLRDAAYLYPSQLSGGMLKRAALARAIIMDPPMLFCDEPGSGLDPVSLASLDLLFLNLKEKFGITIVLITHEVSTISRIADKVVFLHEGRVIFEGGKTEAMESDIPALKDFFSKGAGLS